MQKKYLTLAAELRREIETGQYAGSGRLPAEPELAAKRQVSRQTVRQALALLVEEGLLLKKKGSGCYLRQPAQSTRRVVVAPTYLNDYIFPELLNDIQNALSAQGYHTEVFATQNQSDEEQRVLRRLLENPPAGLLMEGVRTAFPNPNLALYHELERRGVPVVFFHGCPPALGNTVCVSDDNYGGGYLLTRYLIGLGHRKIAGIFKCDDTQGLLRYNGYYRSLQDAALPLPGQNVNWYTTEDRTDLLDHGVTGFLNNFIDTRLADCTAVLCYNDEIAYHLIRALSVRGIRVPEDVSIVSFDGSYYSTLSKVPITSLCHPAHQAGSVLSGLLLQRMRRQPCTAATLPWSLCERASSAPLTRAEECAK